ncbi:MAG: response regulator transcription factor [Nocardioidaceae bacterium]
MAPSTRLQGTARNPVAGIAQHASDAEHLWPTSLGLVLLIADPDASPPSALSSELLASGLNCAWCADGAEALVQYGMLTPDAVLLAPSLDAVDASTVVRTIREHGATPILLGVGPGDADTAGPVLVAGATVAVARPYVAREIVHRLEAEIPDVATRAQLSYGPLELDPRSYSVRLRGEELEALPLKEFELLRLLMMHADRVVATEQIRSALWGHSPHAPSSNSIAVHAARLRSRVGGPTVLRTIRGRGYRLTFPEA